VGIAAGGSFVSIGDLSSIKNALQTMYNNQDPTTGAFPEAGPPLLQKGSDTVRPSSLLSSPRIYGSEELSREHTLIQGS
jgi:hypothetical protein